MCAKGALIEFVEFILYVLPLATSRKANVVKETCAYNLDGGYVNAHCFSLYFPVPLTLLAMNTLNSGAVGRGGGWADRERAGRQGRDLPRWETHRSPEIDELPPHLRHEGFLGHQGPVQALIELHQLAVHLRHLEHTSTQQSAQGRPSPPTCPTFSEPAPGTCQQGPGRLSGLEA